MAVDETKEQQQIYMMLRLCLYAIVAIELIVNIPIKSDSAIFAFIINVLCRFAFFKNIMYCKIAELILIVIISIGTKAKKEIKFNWKTMVIIPCTAGVIFTILSLLFYNVPIGNPNGEIATTRIVYAVCTFLGVMFLLQGLDSISKYLNQRVGEDRFNFENESFEQSTEKTDNEYSVNIPMIFYWQKKMREGWINIINPFRGTLRAENGKPKQTDLDSKVNVTT